MFKYLLKIKEKYINLKKNYFDFVLIEEKNVFYYNQKITYISQNIYGLIQNIISALWMLLLFALVFKDVIYLYLALFILIFCVLLFVLINYFPKVVPKNILGLLLGASYFYKIESDLANKIIYSLFLLFLIITNFFGINMYFFIRLLFFIRCFFALIYLFYQSFPDLQIQVLKNNLITELDVLNYLHPMKKIKLDDFLCLKVESNEVDKDQAQFLLERYNNLANKYEITAVVPYERKIVNNEIVIVEFINIIDGVKRMLDQLEQALESGAIKGSTIIDLKQKND